MMNSKVALVSALTLFVSLNAYSKDFQVRKADGSIGRYKLLPVHLDPSHASIVEERLSSAPRADLPASYQIPKDKLPAVRDQGNRGTCVYFATVGMLESNLIAQSPDNKNVKLSEQCLVGLRNWEADNKDYTGDDRPTDYRPDPDGDYLDLVAKSVTYFGIPEAKKYSDVNCTYSWGGSSAPTSPEKYSALFSSGLSQAYAKGHAFEVDKQPTLEKIKSLLMQNIPVEIATLVYQDHMLTTYWDYNAMDDKPSTLAGGHAIILTGYRDAGSKTVFTFKNSWGDWGNGGYGAITSSLLEHSWKSDAEYDIMVSYHD